MVLNIITRGAWHALPPQRRGEPPEYFNIKRNVFWMNVKFETCNNRAKCAEILARHQMFGMNSQNLWDIRYNFMVGGDGNVYEGRGWTTLPLVPKEYNSLNEESFIIAFLGIFTIETLPEMMKRAANSLIEHGIKNDYIAEDYKLYDLLVVKNIHE